jgi:hypothetical protein
VIVRVQFYWQRTHITILGQSILMYNTIFMRDMVENKKVLLEKVDTLKNIADSLTKSLSVEKLSWCRETMGIVALGQ